MLWRASHWALLAGLLWSWPASATDGVPVQAGLLRSLDAGRLKVGDPVLAKALGDWASSDCKLRAGTLLKGRVVVATTHSKTTKTSEVAVLFDSADCNQAGLKPLPLTLAAVVATDPRGEPGNLENPPLNEAMAVVLQPTGNRSLRAAEATVISQPLQYKPPTKVQPGEVVGIKGMQLQVGAGPEGSSILSTSGHNLRLETGSILVLMPNINAAPTPGAANAAPDVPPPAAQTLTPRPTEDPEPIDESAICEPPQCRLEDGPADKSVTEGASATLPVRDLGYIRPQRDIIGFDYDSAIAYLGDKQLVFTFNPHLLVPRTGAEGKLAKLRVIRAVLINLETKRVLKSVDWKVPDDRQFLWTVGADKLLVHVGQELRIYGPDLRSQQRAFLDGSLAFVRIAPSGQYFAVGVIRERHSEASHREMQDAELREPEEDVEVRILDSNLQTLAKVVQSSRALPPVLSDYGEIRIEQKSRNRWAIVEDSWDKQRHVITKVNSTCRPEATTFPPGLMFLTSCDRQADGIWYRVLRSDGKSMLKAWSPSAELERRVTWAGGGGSFSVGIAEASGSLTPGSPFKAADVQSERVAVYSSQNGERTLSVTALSPVPAVQTFALSPDGSQLAVLQAEQIALYQIASRNRSAEVKAK
jgi:hypothetical protein